MPLLIVLAVLAALLFGPGLWVRRVMKRYSQPQDRYPGSGSEFARHLLDKLGMEHVKVEVTPLGDHYDPDAKAVRLSQGNFEHNSLTAVVVAAHEVGHAVQDFDGYAALTFRTSLAKVAMLGQRFGSALIILLPIALLLLRTPAAGAITLFVALIALSFGTLLHLVTLPVEWDASFGRAMPLLVSGGYLKQGDEQHARRVLKAAALTYVAGALFSLINLWRWIRYLRV